MQKMLLFIKKIVQLALKSMELPPVDLDEYLFRKRISQTDFAKDLGISRNHLGEILRGRRTPSVKLAKKIEELTQGEVTREQAMFPKGRE
ncbi:MAG: helix-turn-helix domain-containing protein [Chlamydiae bacterium]|jgi:transcriptional regulator with XRE-family HTH domain|nr:helix-turn-helix domain-containing protein [Chlamydiota bacterium]